MSCIRESSTETAIMELLLDADKLKFTYDDLLGIRIKSGKYIKTKDEVYTNGNTN